MATVRAIRAGFAGTYREPGDVFEWNGPLGSWMEPVKGKKGGKQTGGLSVPETEPVISITELLMGDGDDQGSEI